MVRDEVAALTGLRVHLPASFDHLGTEALRALANMARDALLHMHRQIAEQALPQRTALLGRIRGTGPGASFGLLTKAVDVSHPTALESPFEGSHSVAGAVLELSQLLAEQRDDAFLKLRFAANSKDLPLHVHEDSDRLIYVLAGRGYFYACPESLPEFTGDNIRCVPIRSRDVLLFPRGTIHTFSTAASALLLLSYHAPHIPLADPRQYTLPARVVCPALRASARNAQVACDPAWTVLV